MKNIKKYMILIPILTSFGYVYAMNNVSAAAGTGFGVNITAVRGRQEHLNCELKEVLVRNNMPEDQFLAEIERLLQAGAQVDNYDGITHFARSYPPLLLFLSKADIKCINKTTQYKVAKLLIDNGANVNAKNFFDLTPLMLCGYNPAIAELLLQHGANVNAIDMYGYTALMGAAERNNIDSIRMLIHWGADKTLKKIADYFFPTGKAAEDFTENQIIKEFIRNYEPEITQLW